MNRDIANEEARLPRLMRHGALLGIFLFIAAGAAYSARLLSGSSYLWLVGIALSSYLIGLIAAERR